MPLHLRLLPLSLLAGTGFLAAGPELALGANATDWNFDVSLNGKPIGAHHFQVVRDGDQVSLQSDASFKVTLLWVPVYHYRHTSRESFRDDCLEKIQANTDENGTQEEVSGAEGDSAFVVSVGGSPVRLPSCVMTFDYWNPRILQQSHLLNPQTGAYTPVVITHLGSEMVTASGKSQPAQTYLLTAEAMKIKLWYSPEQRWLALESTTADGKRMRYQLQ